MRFRDLLLGIMTLSVSATISSATYNITEKGIEIPLQNSTLGGAKIIRVEVRGNKIFHVSATPESSFTDPQSLIILPQKNSVKPSVNQKGDIVKIATKDVAANVSIKTGEVWFTDKNGGIILQEKKDGGKTFTPIAVDGTKGYTIRQIFESPADEAFYGLGQHQADEFNYKCKNEELFQYNTKVSVPFLVSNKKYGILLDSYSLCRFGSPNDYSQLQKLFKLYDKNGKLGALSGTYKTKNGTVIERREDSLYFENLKTIKNLPKDLKLVDTQVVYEGSIEPEKSGEFKFILYYAGYMKVSIDNKLVVPERWRTAWNPNSYKFSVDMTAGRKVPIRIEWIPDGGESYCGLRALEPVSAEEQGRQSWWSEMSKQLDYYFIAGESIDEVISGYRTLTGKAQIMPKWAMGFWQSRERYKTSAEMIDALKGFRKRNIPIDNIVLDWSYWPENAWGSHDFDASRFPNPKAMVDSIHDMKARMMISVWPKFYPTTENYKEFDHNGWIYQQAIKDSLKDWIGQGYHYSFYDAYSSGARKMFWNQMRQKLYPLGIDAWWMDASEPNVRDCTDIDYRKALCGPTALGSSTEFFNAYALMNAEAIYDGQRETDNDKRVFLLTRSGFAGLQRYSTATWSGDIATRWEDMKAQISAGLNFAMSGIPYWTMDIGGFCVENRYVAAQNQWDKTGIENEDYKEWRELNARWYQFGAFAPLYRAHGQFPFREVWNIAPEGHPAYNSITYYTKLRYDLMPYIYSLAGKVHYDDYTIMRALVMDFGADKNVENISDQFMFGPAIMVAPVYRYGDRSRDVYFPANTEWYDFYSGKIINGGQMLIEEAPYERIPLFVKSGSIIPFGPDIQYSDEKVADNICLYVYAGADGSFTLYEDENVNYNYEKGSFAKVRFDYSEAKRQLTIRKRAGSFPGMLEKRVFNIIFVDANHPIGYNHEVKGKKITYVGKEITVNLER